MMISASVLSSGAALAQQYTMKLATSTNNDPTFEWLSTFKRGVEAASGGKIKAEIYPSNQLGSIPRTIEGVALGTIEVVMSASGFFEGIEPRFAVLAAPGLFDGPEHANKVLNTPEVRKRLSTFGATKGVEVLTVVSQSPYAILSHKPIKTLDD